MHGKRWMAGAALSVVALLSSVTAARQSAGNSQPKRSEPPRTITVWMECEECKEERQAVARMGAAALPFLADYLRAGAPADRQEVVRRQLAAAYKNMKDEEAKNPKAKTTMTEQEYVKTYLDNYVALYQVRAATALADIGGAEAVRLLEEAAQAPLRDDVKAVVRSSLERIRKR